MTNEIVALFIILQWSGWGSQVVKQFEHPLSFSLSLSLYLSVSLSCWRATMVASHESIVSCIWTPAYVKVECRLMKMAMIDEGKCFSVWKCSSSHLFSQKLKNCWPCSLMSACFFSYISKKSESMLNGSVDYVLSLNRHYICWIA